MKSVRIFLAEDNAADVWLIEEAIRRQNIPFKIDNYTTAADAIDAVRKCGEGESPVPDLILLDYNLPSGHGAEILEAAAENPRVSYVPKAILTSFLPPGESEKALELGARRVITKPASLDEFMSEVGGNVAELLQSGATLNRSR